MALAHTDPLRYVAWVVWATTTYARLPAERRDAFTQDLFVCFHALTAPLADLPRGKGLALLPGLLAWLRIYPDPLQGLRAAMDGMQARWRSVEARA